MKPGKTPEAVIGVMLAANKKTLSLAESCTGGLVADRITNVSGSSAFFKMGVIAYSNEAKVKLLGVSEKDLDRYGAVSRVVASQMAAGMRRLSGSDISLAITGIAGPTGATGKKKVGLVYISLTDGKKTQAKKFLFKGSRMDVKCQAGNAALDMLVKAVR